MGLVNRLVTGVVDSEGRQINSNRYIALIAAITLQDYPGATIVTDSVTSNGLTKFITQLGALPILLLIVPLPLPQKHTHNLTHIHAHAHWRLSTNIQRPYETDMLSLPLCISAYAHRRLFIEEYKHSTPANPFSHSRVL
jgi:hypothetical protein